MMLSCSDPLPRSGGSREIETRHHLRGCMSAPVTRLGGDMSETPNPVLDASHEGDVLVVTVLRKQIEGEEVAQALKEELLAHVARSGLSKVVMDLRNTRYVSSIVFWP